MSKSLSIFLFLGAFFLAGLFGILWYLNTTQNISSSMTASQPTPTLAPIQPQEVHSIDGTQNLIMKAVQNPDKTTTYSFITDTIPPSIQTLLYTKTVANDTTFSVPLNAWSPENTYLFITENIPDSEQDNFYVFQSSGEPFANGEEYLDAVSLFTNKFPDHSLGEITGWDAPTLLHVKTEKGNKKGPLYWFDVPNRTFYPLYRTQ